MEQYKEASSRISRDQATHVARLARLKIDEDELDVYTRQLSAVLDYAAQVAAIDTAGVAPTSHPIPLVNVAREDIPSPSVDREEVLSMAPSTEDAMFKVPRIMEDSP
jgi:aspartyl-tRNA(Asn)/glutamyl-tRNA(Gln) amidotransferase subunit C